MKPKFFIEYNGEQMSIGEISKITGFTYSSIHYGIRVKKMSVEETVNILKQGGLKKVKEKKNPLELPEGTYDSYIQLSNELNISRTTLRKYMTNLELPLKEAVEYIKNGGLSGKAGSIEDQAYFYKGSTFIGSKSLAKEIGVRVRFLKPYLSMGFDVSDAVSNALEAQAKFDEQQRIRILPSNYYKVDRVGENPLYYYSSLPSDEFAKLVNGFDLKGTFNPRDIIKSVKDKGHRCAYMSLKKREQHHEEIQLVNK